MIDSHTHLNLDPLHGEYQAVWQRAREAGVASALVVGTDIDSSKEAIKICKNQSGLFSAAGIHPEVINLQNVLIPNIMADWEKSLEVLIENENVSAVGECGLDYSQIHKLEETKAKQIITGQKKLFGMQIQLAKKHNLPLSIHCRNRKKPLETSSSVFDAYQDLLDTLEHYSKTDGVLPRFVLHCISGPINYLKQGLKLGGFISFAGNVTYKNSNALQDLLRKTPLDRLLLETDAPFLSPQSKRGKPNEPGFILETYHFVAKYLHIPLPQLDQLITNNFDRFLEKRYN